LPKKCQEQRKSTSECKTLAKQLIEGSQLILS